MRLKIIVFLMPILLLSLDAVAQNGDYDARKRFAQAEDLYLHREYAESLLKVNEVEKLLGSKNPKTQYLKVLVYEKLALQDITYLPQAQTEIQVYLSMQNELSVNHRKNVTFIQELKTKLPIEAESLNKYRIELAKEKEKQLLIAESKKPRLGMFFGVPTKNWIGFDYGITLGNRSGFGTIGSSTEAGKSLTDNQFNKEISDKLKSSPEGTVIKKTIVHLGYFQGMRILPRKKDFIKPFVGARVLYDGNYSKVYLDDKSVEVNPQIIANLKTLGLDPSNYYTGAATKFETGISLDLVAGLMFHFKGVTCMTGLDVLNSKMIQTAINFKID